MTPSPSEPQTGAVAAESSSDGRAAPRPPAGAGLTGRAVCIGLVMVGLTVWLVTYAELVTQQIMIGYLQAPPVAIFLLLVVAASNLLVHRLSPAKALTTAEIATVYAMMVPAAMVASHGILQRILPVMAAGNYFADNSNAWITTYFPHTAPWLVIWNPHGPVKQPAVVEFYEGLRRGHALPWGVWVRPLASWLLMFGFVYGAFLSMATILRKQWSDREKLSFPLVQLPLEMIRGAGDTGSAAAGEGVSGFFRSGLAWIGFGLPMIVFGINGLHHMYPTVPLITLEVDLSPLLTQRPWNGMGYSMVNFSFAALGFSYLLPTELLFSLWFFFLLARVQELGFALGGEVLPDAVHGEGKLMIAAQTEGAWVMLAVITLAAAKPHLKSVWRAVWSSKAVERGQGEMISYRSAFWLLVICCVGITAWCAAAGMNAWLAIFVFGLYLFVQAIIMARSTAEAGMIMTEGCWTPTDILSLGFSPHSLGAANLTALSYTDAVFTRDLRSLMLTAFLDMQQLADSVGLRLRSLKSALLISIVAAVVIGTALQIWLPYHKGANSMYSWMYQDNATQFFNEYLPDSKPGPPQPLYGSQWFALLGAAVTLAMGILRARVAWWPLHPLGYALMASWTTTVFWFTFLLAWIVKTAVLRYGGIKVYRTLRPLFIGMILGEFSAAAIWTLIAAFTPISAPAFPWP
jgi:hypothetical protein